MSELKTTAKLAIGLPVYNGARFLRESVESLLAQSYGDFRLTIADNASTDGTEEIGRELARRDPRVRYVRHAENIGAARNFNFVFRSSSGEYFKWAAHDDVCEPEFLARCVEGLEADAGAVVSHTASYWFDREGRVLGVAEIDPAACGDRVEGRLRAALECGYPTLIWGVMRRCAAATTPLIASFVNSDRYFLGELLMLGRARVHPEFLFGVRQHESSFSGEFERSSRQAKTAWFDPRMRLNGMAGQVGTLARLARRIATEPMTAGERASCLRYVGWRTGKVLTRRARRLAGLGEARRQQRARREGDAMLEYTAALPTAALAARGGRPAGLQIPTPTEAHA